MTESWDRSWKVKAGPLGKVSAEEAFAATMRELTKVQEATTSQHGRPPSRMFCATHGLSAAEAEKLERIVGERLTPGRGSRVQIKRERDPHHGYPWWSVTVTLRADK